MKDRSSLKLNKLSVAVICATLFVMVFIVMMIAVSKETTKVLDGSPAGINELILNSNEPTDESIVDTEKNTEQKGKGRSLRSAGTEKTVEEPTGAPSDVAEMALTAAVPDDGIQDAPADLLNTDLDSLRNKDEATTIRYFGESKAFSAEVVADKLAATKATILSEEIVDDSTVKLLVHICSFDYHGMKEASVNMQEEMTNTGEENIEDTVKKEIAKQVVNGNFTLHYTIPLEIKDGAVVVTEEFKQAITGGWYKGLNTELKQVDCPL